MAKTSCCRGCATPLCAAWAGMSCVVLIGVLFVATGLLSSRTLLTDRTPPSHRGSLFAQDQKKSDVQSPPAGGPLVDQVVVVLIDALRPDFALPSYRGGRTPGGGSSSARNGAHSFTYIEQALQDTLGQHDAVGMVLVADAPTTTSQRLKAIATGTIPAFVEAGANFNSDAVVEDSLIHQLNGSAVVLGDDTWTALFPQEDPQSGSGRLWKETFVLPSFDVRDLHSVDNEVLSNLASVLDTPSGKEAPKLVIAHFLGVDHAGHRYHATDEHLQKKVVQLNVALRNITQHLRRRAAADGTSTMMLVFGDHGMTESGDHGGEAREETDSFLFAELFSRKENTNAARNTSAIARKMIAQLSGERQSSCQQDQLCRFYERDPLPDFRLTAQGTSFLPGTWQIDLVPTIASLLDIPIPFSNIGRVIPEVVALSFNGRTAMNALLPTDVEEKEEEGSLSAPLLPSAWGLLDAFHHANSRQVQTYLNAMGKAVPIQQEDDVGDDNAEDSGDNEDAAETGKDHWKSVIATQKWLGRVGREARNEWSTIHTDRLLMGCGALLMGFLMLIFLFITPVSRDGLPPKGFQVFLRCVVIMGNIFWLGLVAWSLLIPQDSLAEIGDALPVVRFFVTYLRPPLWLCGALGGVIPCVTLLWSTRLGAGTSAAYAHSFVPQMLLAWKRLTGIRAKASSDDATLLPPSFGVLLLAQFGVMFVRYAAVFANSFVVKESDIIQWAAASLAFLSVLLSIHLFRTARLTTVAAQLSNVVLLLACLRVALWLGQRRRYHGTHIIDVHAPIHHYLDWISARVEIKKLVDVSGCVLIAVMMRVASLKESSSWAPPITKATIGALLYWSLLDQTPWMHWGLLIAAVTALIVVPVVTRSASKKANARIVFASYVVMWFSSLNAVEAPYLRFQYGLLVASLVAFNASLPQLKVGKSLGTVKAVSAVRAHTFVRDCMIHLLSWAFFFALSQQCAITSINWNAAFAGLSEYHMIAGGTLVWLNTFAAFLLVPFLWVILRRSIHHSELPPTLLWELRWTMCGYYYLACSQVMLSSVAVSLHRRHLFLWAVFCPKFLYDVIICLASVLGALLGTSLVA